MTTLEIKTDLRLKIKNKSANDLLKIYENNQKRVDGGVDLEDCLIVNDIVTEEMEERLKKTSFFTGGLLDNQIYLYFKSKV